MLALERGVLDALRADADVQAVLGAPARVFDGGAEAPAYPYLELVRHSIEDVSGADAPMWRHELDLAVMTSVGGRDEAKAAADAVRRVVDADGVAVDEYRVVVGVVRFVDVVRATTHTWRALVRLRLVVEAVG